VGSSLNPLKIKWFEWFRWVRILERIIKFFVI
jgi:hypothetical protein